MLLVVDNGSVYTKNLIDFLTKKKVKFVNLKHNQVKLSEIQNYNSFILSGRSQNNKEMNVLNSKIIQHVVIEQKNLLGICYGAEILALTIGGTIRKKNILEKGDQEITILKENPLWFETMIFGGEHDCYEDRYETWEEAEVGHRKAMDLVHGS